jgi:ribosomal protein L35
MSMSKAVSKRIKITRNDKLVRRPMAVGHFRTRTNAKAIRNKRRTRPLAISIQTLKNY